MVPSKSLVIRDGIMALITIRNLAICTSTLSTIGRTLQLGFPPGSSRSGDCRRVSTGEVRDDPSAAQGAVRSDGASVPATIAPARAPSVQPSEPPSKRRARSSRGHGSRRAPAREHHRERTRGRNPHCDTSPPSHRTRGGRNSTCSLPGNGNEE